MNKSTWKPKNKKSSQKLFNLFQSKTFIQIFYVYIICNIKPWQTQLILNCVLLLSMCVNHPKMLTTQKLSSPLGLIGLKSFHGFFIVGGKIEPIAGCSNRNTQKETYFRHISEILRGMFLTLSSPSFYWIPSLY